MERQNAQKGKAPRYIKRSLAGALARATAPVVILEGAHGVGKTTLVKNEPVFRSFHYVTLADKSEFAKAAAQPEEWIANLPRPAIIDDIHRIAFLLETALRAIASECATSLLFVLISSERLRVEDGFGAIVQRFVLFPLTQAEIHQRRGCVVDDLFDGAITQGFHALHTRSDLRVIMRIGGFPARVTRPAATQATRAAQATRMMRPCTTEPTCELREPCTPDSTANSQTDLPPNPNLDIDRLIERSILKKMLSNPGASVSMKSMARACYVDEDTLTSYLELFRSKFLIHCLPLLDRQEAQEMQKTPFAKTRIHPIDTMLVVEALREAGRDIALQPPVFAKVLKTFCIHQIVAAAQWASEPTECCYWRMFDHRKRDTDLVLNRGNRLVGITVRNSVAACCETIGALRLLAQDERFARGFIIYMGTSLRQLTENIWAIPVSTLWERGAFLTVDRASHDAQSPA